jgi:hypothetical protein
MSSARAILVIADIGGYTSYMSSHRMSLAHAEVNTGRLLNTLVDAAPGLELVEIEGDAAFFYRWAGSTPADQLVDEVAGMAAAMHQAFHREREYVARNLCPCSGCKEAGSLKLKFIAHVGEVATQKIRDRIKLVGIDVIMVHRLLKNPVTVPEYVLLTDELRGDGATVLRHPTHEVAADLEGIGPVRAFYVDVADLEVPVPVAPGPTWRGRLERTAYAAGAGLPYMLGLRRRRRDDVALLAV